MRRRDFLRTLIAIPPALATRSVLSERQALANRAAIVIGINKSGNLPALSAAVSGARKVTNWLKAEGFDVKEFLDEDEPITVDPIYKAIEQLIDRGTLEQLVIYFSGHGCTVNYSEHWFLSDAPRNPNASISILESVELAGASAIPNVVFISDACRSATDSLGVQRMHGGLIFPIDNYTGFGRVKVDQFYAALPGQAAFELPVDKSVKNYEGIYTSAFLRAYRAPAVNMLRTVRGAQVVPNRRLEDYLIEEVQKRAKRKSITLLQEPESRVLSDDKVYIGRYIPEIADMGNYRPPPVPGPTVADVANAELERTGLVPSEGKLFAEDPRELTAKQLTSVSNKTGFKSSLGRIMDFSTTSQRISRQVKTRTGFTVFGTRLELVQTNHRVMDAKVLERGDGKEKAAIVELKPSPRSVILRFADGSGTIVANLPGHIGTLVIEDGLVISVSYLSPWSENGNLDDRRAVVATAAQFGVFQIKGTSDDREKTAKQLDNSLRVGNSVDPTLGIYAAYAYANVGLVDHVHTVGSMMKTDLGTNLFDVAMLAGDLSGRYLDGLERVVPFCPMLGQGWDLLRVRGIRLPDFLDKASAYLRPALWTTFDPAGMDIIMRGISNVETN